MSETIQKQKLYMIQHPDHLDHYVSFDFEKIKKITLDHARQAELNSDVYTDLMSIITLEWSEEHQAFAETETDYSAFELFEHKLDSIAKLVEEINHSDDQLVGRIEKLLENQSKRRKKIIAKAFDWAETWEAD
jgi:hypothetical protein